jgi:hypothetical protein
MRKSTSKQEFLRRLEHRSSRLGRRWMLMPEGRREKRLGLKVARLDIRIEEVRKKK